MGCGYSITINQKTARKIWLKFGWWEPRRVEWRMHLHNAHETVKHYHWPSEIFLSGSEDGSKLVLDKYQGKVRWRLWTYMGNETLDEVFKRFSLPEKFRQTSY